MLTMPLLNIEVVYALQTEYRCISLQVEKGTSIEQAIVQSGMLALYADIDLKVNQVGIFNQIKTLDVLVEEGDRIEIYRPLRMSAMAARALRASKQTIFNQRSVAKRRV